MQVMVRCNWFNSWHTGMCVTQLPGSKALGRPAGRRQLLFAPRRAGIREGMLGHLHRKRRTYRREERPTAALSGGAAGLED